MRKNWSSCRGFSVVTYSQHLVILAERGAQERTDRSEWLTRWESNIKEPTKEAADYCSRVTLTRGLLTRVQRVAPVIGWSLVSDRWTCVK
jgi:hypothetical protein